MSKTIAAIVDRSGAVELPYGSRTGLGLAPDEDGKYRLGEILFDDDDVLPGRVHVTGETGGGLATATC